MNKERWKIKGSIYSENDNVNWEDSSKECKLVNEDSDEERFYKKAFETKILTN